MHMWNVQFGVRMRKLCFPEDLHPGQTSQTGLGRSDRFGDRSDRSRMPNSSYELYFDTIFGRVSTPKGYKPPHPINMKGYG